MFTQFGVCLEIMFPPASKLYHIRENPDEIDTDNSRQGEIQIEKRILENVFSNHDVIILEINQSIII